MNLEGETRDPGAGVTHGVIPIFPETLLGRLIQTAMLVGGYSVVMMAGGHGVGPVGLLVVFGQADEFQGMQLTGWLGLGLLLPALLHRRTFRLFAPAAFLALGASLMLVVGLSEVWPFTAVTMIPFLCAVGIVLRNLIQRGHVPRAGSSM